MRFLALLFFALAGADASAQTIHQHALPYVPGPSLVRIINQSDQAGEVRIHGIDDAGERFGPIMLSLDGYESQQFSTRQLETGLPGRGLDGGLGDGRGAWQIFLNTSLDILALAYRRVRDGLTTIHATIPEVEGVHHVPLFYPASHPTLRSTLRIVNPNDEPVSVTITGRDDRGMLAPDEAQLTIAPGAARMLSAAWMDRQLGDDAARWQRRQLFITADRDVWVMNLLRSTSGIVTSLSAQPSELETEEPPPPSRSLSWSGRFSETSANNGEVSGRVIVRLTGGRFTADVVSARHVRASNVPAGLTAHFVRTNATTITMALTGRARSHANANDARNLTVAFADGAFERGDATSVERSTHRGLRVDFRDPPADLAPANASEFLARVRGKKVVATIGGVDTSEYLFSSGGRLTARDLDSGLGVTGRWTYRKGSRNRATMRVTADGVPGECNPVELQFTSRTSGRFSSFCTGYLTGGTGTFRITNIF